VGIGCTIKNKLLQNPKLARKCPKIVKNHQKLKKNHQKLKKNHQKLKKNIRFRDCTRIFIFVLRIYIPQPLWIFLINPSSSFPRLSHSHNLFSKTKIFLNYLSSLPHSAKFRNYILKHSKRGFSRWPEKRFLSLTFLVSENIFGVSLPLKKSHFWNFRNVCS